MARVDLTVSQMDFDTGLVLSTTAGDATDHHSFTNASGDVFIYVNNGSGGSLTVTALTPQTVTSASLTVEDREYTVANGAVKFIGPFPTATFNQSDGKVYFNLSADTSVTLMAIKHGPSS